MKQFLSARECESLQATLPELRSRFASTAATGEERLLVCCELVEAYCALELFDRSAFWVERGVGLCRETSLVALQGRYYLCSAWASAGLEDRDGLTRGLEQFASLPDPDPLSVTISLALEVHRLLMSQDSEPFSTFERAFRHLRVHPDPYWVSYLLLRRAQWLRRKGLVAEALASLKKMEHKARDAEIVGLELQALIEIAEVSVGSRPKAVRAARTALEKGLAFGFAEVSFRASKLLSVLDVGKREAELALGLIGQYDEAERRQLKSKQFERAEREADSATAESVGKNQNNEVGGALALILSTFAQHSDLSRCLDLIYAPLRSVLAADIFGIALWSPEKEALDYSLFVEEGRRTGVGMIPVKSSRSLGAWCFREGKPIRINDIEQEFGLYLKELSKLSDHRPRSMLFLPVLGGGRTLGVVTVQAFRRGAYGPESEDLLQTVAAGVSLRLQTGLRSAD